MQVPLARKVAALLILQLFCVSLPLSAQQQSREENRPRRVQPEWRPQPQPATEITSNIVPASPEPKIRVALATDVRSATISTTGRLMNASGGTTLIALDTPRVRVEPRILSPAPVNLDQDYFQLTVAVSPTRVDAEQSVREVKKLTGEDVEITFDTETNVWGLLVEKKYSFEEAEEIRGRLEDSGFDATVSSLSRKSGKSLASEQVSGSTSTGMSTSSVRLASRPSLPSREVVASAGNSRLFSSSAPVSFVSDSETSTPVRYNDKPYRGRIEVFTNLRGTLTVVNELGIEDYVRGVVANELSPGGYPALEALKAQAVAARTYALKNRGQFMSQGYDILPTTRSQVYRGLSSENALSTRAVDETRGMVATYNGEPINALYTSTCGGRTENSENIFNESVPYLRARECAVEGKGAFAQFTIKTSRDPADVRDEKHVLYTRDVALLAVENFALLRARVSDSWFATDAPVSEIRGWLASVARLAHQMAPVVTDEVNRPPAFATALNAAVFGENRATTLLNNADVDYFLAIRDATEVPAVNRADLALLLREGYLSIYPDATLRPQEPLSRGRALHTIARILEARGLLQIQRGTTRPAASDQLILRSSRGKDQAVRVSADAFLFRQIGESLYPVRSVVLVGGEPVVFHLSPAGEVDYLEVRPATNGAGADRFSPFSNWQKEMLLGQLQARLARSARGIGPIVDLRVAARGSSRRVTDLEVIGANGIAHVRGGRIRSALGLREQLFVIDRKYDDSGRVISLNFIGRGWGHGVGMCQVGAYGLARQGWSYEQILKAYYTGIEITRLY